LRRDLPGVLPVAARIAGQGRQAKRLSKQWDRNYAGMLRGVRRPMKDQIRRVAGIERPRARLEISVDGWTSSTAGSSRRIGDAERCWRSGGFADVEEEIFKICTEVFVRCAAGNQGIGSRGIEQRQGRGQSELRQTTRGRGQIYARDARYAQCCSNLRRKKRPRAEHRVNELIAENQRRSEARRFS